MNMPKHINSFNQKTYNLRMEGGTICQRNRSRAGFPVGGRTDFSKSRPTWLRKMRGARPLSALSGTVHHQGMVDGIDDELRPRICSRFVSIAHNWRGEFLVGSWGQIGVFIRVRRFGSHGPPDPVRLTQQLAPMVVPFRRGLAFARWFDSTLAGFRDCRYLRPSSFKASNLAFDMRPMS